MRDERRFGSAAAKWQNSFGVPGRVAVSACSAGGPQGGAFTIDD
jgi:hypothetical protein